MIRSLPLIFSPIAMVFMRDLLTKLVFATVLLCPAASQAATQFGNLHCSPGTENQAEEGLAEKIEKAYDQLSTLRSSFHQESYFLGSDQRKQSDGQVYFERPGKMDWRYGAPDEQRFTSDGKNVWWYQPKENQVLVRTLRQSFSSEVPVSFLLGVGKLHENFIFQSRCPVSRGVLVKFKPKSPTASLDEFFLLVDAKDFRPVGARIVDMGGNETSIIFGESNLNEKIEASHFKLEIPKGTDVIDERDPVEGSR